ncbi:MFS transporter [Phycicoccus flavus]|uniref:MFS transporter n=1 Tax=Phycicoccus flavus TaxID=2502783 RepID=UPI000FEBEDB7|nr:MFS transporter [Phycicoccus flavus]NHA68113.1 MFS transporter [Phycicoccus flavus]
MTTAADTPPAATPGAAPAADATPAGPTRRTWAGFAVVLGAVVLNILDSTIVNVAAPSIRAELAMSTSSLEWVAAAYTLALAVGLVASARLGDVVGRRRMLLLGLGGFVLTSVACAAAPTGDALVVARALQGLAAATMVPQCFGLVRELFTPARVGTAMGAMGPAIGLSTVLGPVVAGSLMQLDAFGTGWRSLFLVNVPVGLAAIAVGRRVLPANRRAPGARVDVVGTAMLGAVSLLLTYPLVEGRALGWPLWVFGLLLAVVPLLVVFVRHQRGRVAAGASTVIEPSVLRKSSYVAGIVFMAVFFGAVVGVQFVVGVFLQVGLDKSAFDAGLYLSSLAVGSLVGAGVGSWAAQRVGRPVLHVGTTTMAAGCLVLWFSLRGSAEVGVAALSPGLALFGLGMGMIFVPLFAIVLGGIEDHEVGSATGLLTATEQLGASLGIAGLATLFFHVYDLESGGPLAAAAAGRHLLAAEHTLLASIGLAALAWGLAWFLPRRARTDAGAH